MTSFLPLLSPSLVKQWARRTLVLNRVASVCFVQEVYSLIAVRLRSCTAFVSLNAAFHSKLNLDRITSLSFLWYFLLVFWISFKLIIRVHVTDVSVGT